MKKLGKILVFGALGLFALWAVFFCLRYLVYQKSVSLPQGFKDHFAAVGGIYGDLHFFDDKFTILWKAAAWIITWFVLAFAILLVIEGVFKAKPFMFIACLAVVLTGFAIVDYIAMSGNYAHYIGKFNGKNTFYFLALIGYVIMSIGIFAIATAGAVLCSIGNEPKEEAAEEEAAPAEQPAEEPKEEEQAPAAAEEAPAEEAPAEEPANEEAPAEEQPAAEEAPAEEAK